MRISAPILSQIKNNQKKVGEILSLCLDREKNLNKRIKELEKELAHE